MSFKVNRNSLASLRGYLRYSRVISIFHISSQFEVLYPSKYCAVGWWSYLVPSTKLSLHGFDGTTFVVPSKTVCFLLRSMLELGMFRINCLWLNLFGLYIYFRTEQNFHISCMACHKAILKFVTMLPLLRNKMSQVVNVRPLVFPPYCHTVPSWALNTWQVLELLF